MPKIARMTPLSQAVFDFLLDGQWHPLQEVQEATMHLVPPGEALRLVNRDRKTPRVYPKSKDQLIQAGQRRKVRETLNSMVNNNRAVRKGRGHTGVKEYRLAPRHLDTPAVLHVGPPSHHFSSGNVEVVSVDPKAIFSMSVQELDDLEQQISRFNDNEGTAIIRSHINLVRGM